MQRRNRRLQWACFLFAVAAYFSTAVWLDRTYVDLTPRGRTVVPLIPPFERFNHAALVRRDLIRKLDDLADEDIEGDAGSPVVIYEEKVRLGPAHSTFGDVDHLGSGRFAHLRSS